MANCKTLEINNPNYTEPTQVRLTYEGCDFLKLPDEMGKPDFFQNPIINFLSNSTQAIILCKVNGSAKFFYVNKAQRIVVEIKKTDIKALQEYKNLELLKTIALPLEQIEKISSDIKNPQIYARAKKVKDIELFLTKEQRRKALMVLDDEHINFKNTSYTYAFQGFLARYMGHSTHEKASLEHKKNKSENITPSRFSFLKLFRSKEEQIAKIDEMQKWAGQLHTLSAQFKDLEDFINNACGDHVIQLKNFRKVFESYNSKIEFEIEKIIKSLSTDDPRVKILTRLKINLKNNADAFRYKLDEIAENPKKADLECLFSIGDRALTIKSLGSFMHDQMTFILDAGIDVSYKISNQRLKDVIQVPKLVAALSDAKHLMLIKGQSIVEGPKDNDTYSPISQSMRDSITGSQIITEDGEDFFSIKPYIKKWHPSAVDNVLCLLTDNHLDDNNLHGNWRYHVGVQLLKFIASIFEIAFSIPRIIIVLSLGIIETGLSILPFPKKHHEDKITYKINQFISNIYADFAFILAPLTYLKNSSWNKYKRNQKDSKHNNHQEILESCTDYSGYCYSLFIYFTPQLISESVHDFFKSIFTTIVKFTQDISYLSSSSKDSSLVYHNVKMRHDFAKLSTSLIKQKFSQDDANKISEGYEKVKYCHSNDISSPLDVFYEIMVVLSNDVVNPMFRKSPGIATFYFALSLLTFGTFVLPASSLAFMKPLPAWLQYLANQISINFTGKSTSIGVTEQLIACFLGWKLGFFSTEFVVEMMSGNFELLEKIFEDPEQIVLGAVVLVGLGMALQYIPELPSTIKIPGLPSIPNVYIVLINLFSEESREVWHGTVGLTSIEYAFLGLKFAMLFHSMLYGSEKSSEELTSIDKIAVVLGNKEFFKKLLAKCNELKVMDSIKTDTDFIEDLKKKDFNNSTNPKVINLTNMIKTLVTEELSKKGLSSDSKTADIFSGLLLEQIAGAKDFLDSESYKQVKKIAQERDCAQQVMQPSTSLIDAHKALTDAISMTIDEKPGLNFAKGVFGLNSESHQYYDYLDKLFEDYNAAVRREYSDDKEIERLSIDKRPYLDVFYNKYCYKSSNNFVRSMNLLFYPVTLLSRGVKFAWAMVNNKPSMKHQIVKNFCKDVVIVSQIFTPLARITADLNLYLSGVARGIAFAIILPVAGLVVYPIVELFSLLRSKANNNIYVRTQFSQWFAVIDYYICKYIAFHKTPALQPVRQFLVRAARVAGINSDLVSAAKKIDSQLVVSAKNFNKLDETPGADTQSYNTLVKAFGVGLAANDIDDIDNGVKNGVGGGLKMFSGLSNIGSSPCLPTGNKLKTT